MIDLKEFINGQQKAITTDAGKQMEDIVLFLLSNDWFGVKPVLDNGKVMITAEQAAVLSQPLQLFLSSSKDSQVLIDLLDDRYPLTAKYLKQFFKEDKTSEDTKFYVTDFLLYYLTKDLLLYRDTEAERLVSLAVDNLTKAHGDCLTFFLAWLRLHAKTAYYKDFIMAKRYTMTVQNSAYAFDDYLNLMYYLFNVDYIDNNDMYSQAAKSQNYTDTWLYLSLHYVCTIRNTDLVRIYRPYLPYPPDEVLRKIDDGSFSDNDARQVLLSITKRMCLLPFTPNKTSSATGISSVKFHIPTSCDVHFGILFAAAEAHRELNGDMTSPIVRKITSYEDITRYMGDEIGELFLESDFRSRSATKSFLQSIYMVGDAVLKGDDNKVWGMQYIMVSLARSHKGSYGKFASTTFEYLKDANFSGLTPEFVVHELLERGVLSCIPSMLLNMITDGQYKKLDVKQQTSLIKGLDLRPNDVETIVSAVSQSQKQAKEAVAEAIQSNTDILSVLHRIGSGQAFSKMPECLCLKTALHQLCPYANNRQCIGCKYEISTKSTFYLLISEYNRLRILFRNTNNKHEKEKYRKLITQILLPKFDETLSCLRDNYGQDVCDQYEQLLKENT